MTYQEKLQDPRWQKKRLSALNEAGWSCQLCGESKNTLHVHHKQYFKGREPWEYENDQLVVLCKHCHQVTHETQDKLLDVISRLPLDGPGSREEAAFLIAGFVGLELEPQAKWHTVLQEAGAQARELAENNFCALARGKQ